jgi:hypothetical protein
VKELYDNDVEYSKMGEQMFTMKSEVVNRPSVLSDAVVQSVDQNICESRRFTISELSCEFQQILLTVLYQIIIFRLGSHKFCPRCIPEMLMVAHNTQIMASAFVDIFRTVLQSWQRISQSHHTNNR